MKKMLVSDYDQTLDCGKLVLYYNLEKIREFMQKGNIFVLSTGRGYLSIMHEIKKYNIPYHYLSCANGRNLCNNNNQLLYSSYIEQNIIAYLEELFEKDLIKKITKKDAFEKDTNNKIARCIVEAITLESAKEMYQHFINHFTNIKVEKFLKMLFLYTTSNNKSFTIEIIKQLEQIADEDIFTIGDHNNDALMIKDHNGFNMLWATRQAKEYSLGTYLTVGQLINDINNDKVKIRKR